MTLKPKHFSRTVDANAGGEALECVQPLTYQAGRTVAIVAPGRSGGPQHTYADTAGGPVIEALVDAGLVSVAAALKNNNPNATEWGNSSHIARIATARAWAEQAWVGGQNYPECTDEKVVLVGWSAGALACLNYARTVPSEVAAIIIWNAAVDLEDMRANNRGSYATEIEARWTDNATWQAARPTNNPVEYAAADLAGIPILQQYASDDATVDDGSATNALAFAAEIGATTNGATVGGAWRKLVNLGAVGHSGAPDSDEIADFLAVASVAARL